MCHQVFKRRVSGTDFFGLKLGSPGQIIVKIWVSGAEKLGFKMQNFRKIEVGSLELEKGLKWWVSGPKNGLKRGSWGWHIPVLPSNVSVPPPVEAYTSTTREVDKQLYK